jgi:hypothetical protein
MVPSAGQVTVTRSPSDQACIENLIAAQRDNLDLEWIRGEWQPFASLDDPRMLRFMEWVGPKT